jgi:peptide deformylase
LGGFGGFLRAAQAREPVQAGVPVLRERARQLSLEELASPETQALIEEMVLVSRARGVGLAAPQLGVGVAIIVLEDTAEDVAPAEAEAQERKAFGLKVLVNPSVTPKPGAARVAFFEGCLSVQGYRGLVERALEVDVTALGADGQPVAFTARGWQVRACERFGAVRRPALTVRTRRAVCARPAGAHPAARVRPPAGHTVRTHICIGACLSSLADASCAFCHPSRFSLPLLSFCAAATRTAW